MNVRLAVFSDSFYPELGGIQDSILATARELGARGHQILLVAPAAAPRDFTRIGLPVREPDLGPNVRIHRVRSMPVPSSSQQSRLAIPSRQSRDAVAAFEPNLIHTHTFLGIGLQAVRTARGLETPLIGTNHWSVGGFDLYVPFFRGAFRRITSRLVARYYQQCDCVTAPSQFTIEEMQTSGLRRPCSVVSNPIDTTLFHTVTPQTKQELKSRLNLGNSVVVCAGRLGREKRVDVLIRAIAAARQSVPDISLVVAGHGSARDQLEKLANELGIADRVRFVGTLNHAALAELFAAADAFAIASTSETQSMVLLQAMACGLPVVGAVAGGLVEHIPPSVGSLADSADPTDFAQKLAQLLAEPRAIEPMKQASRTFAERFSITSIADTWEDIYGRTVSDRCRPGSQPQFKPSGLPEGHACV